MRERIGLTRGVYPPSSTVPVGERGLRGECGRETVGWNARKRATVDGAGMVNWREGKPALVDNEEVDDADDGMPVSS